MDPKTKLLSETYRLFNPHHDRLGRFATKTGGAVVSGARAVGKAAKHVAIAELGLKGSKAHKNRTELAKRTKKMVTKKTKAGKRLISVANKHKKELGKAALVGLGIVAAGVAVGVVAGKGGAAIQKGIAGAAQEYGRKHGKYAGFYK